MMSDKMNTVNDEDMIRMAFRVLDKDGSGTISAKSFTHLMTHIGNMRTGVVENGQDIEYCQNFRGLSMQKNMYLTAALQKK